MSADWQISAGYLSEFARPALFVLAVVASAWVLRDTFRRGLHPYVVGVWTLFAFILPHVTLPLYLALRIFSARNHVLRPAETTNSTIQETEQSPAATLDGAQSNDAMQAEEAGPRSDRTPPAATRRSKWALALPLLHASLLLSAGALYFYLDYRSADAGLARAESAKLFNQRERAISEYRAALAREPDAHTRKLLGVELLKAERWEEALAELRAAESEGEPDEAIPFHAASALRALDRRDEAAAEYRKFLQSQACTQPLSDPRCGAAQNFLKKFDESRSGGR